MKKRIWAYLLTVVMVVGLLPTVALAEEGTTVSTEEELLKAIEEAEGTKSNPTVIVVEDDIVLTETLKIGEVGSSKHIELVGAVDNDYESNYSISAAEDGFNVENASMIIVSENSSLTTSNITLDANQKSRVVNVLKNASFTMEDGTWITNGCSGQETTKTSGGGLYTWSDGAEITINGGLISKCQNDGGGNGAGVTVALGTFYMYGGTITENKGSYAGGVYMASGTGYFSGGSITGNTCTDKQNNSISYGGGVFVNPAAKVYFGGDAVVKDNYDGYDRISNIWLGQNQDSVIYLQEAFSGNIGLRIVSTGIGSREAVVKAADGYTITDEDMSNMEINGQDYALYLDSNNNLINIADKNEVSFDANGGQGKMSPQAVPNNIETVLKENTFTNKDKKFVGWSTTADGEVVYTDGASVAFNADTTLYAKWEDCILHQFSNGVCVLCGHKQSVLSTDIGEKTFTVGVPVEFTFSTKANDDADIMVVGTSNFSNTEAIEKLEYLEIKDGNWYEFSGDFGSAEGFPMQDATSRFRATFKKVGTYKFTASVKPVDSEEVLCSTEVEFTVSNHKLELTADKTQMKGSGTVTLKLSGLQNGDIATVECDDTSVSVKDNGDGTYSAYLPNRTQTYTFVAKATNAEKYTNGEVAVSVTKKSSSSSSSGTSSTQTYTVSKADGMENGKVSVDLSKAEKGDKVTFTVTPDKGYEINKVMVKDADGNKIEVKEKGDGEYTFTMPDSKVEIKATFSKMEETPVVEEVKPIILTIDQKVANVYGELIVNDVAPVIRNERTMLPIRFIAEALGGTVAWDGVQNKVTIIKDDTSIEIFIGQPFALVNGVPVELDAPAFIENDRTYLPLRFVAENLGATVTWNAETQEVTILPQK